VGAWSDYLANVRALPRTVWGSLVRHGAPVTDRSRAEAVFQNLFLHLHPTRVHRWSLKGSYTLGLGLICAASFALLLVTGVLLMFYYKPSSLLAYQSIKDIHYVVPSGRFMRNIHRWGAHIMVIAVILHMARVFYTSSYKKPREMNWVFGLALLVLTLGLSFSGYLLPWDQLAYWAVTIGANIAQSPKELTDAAGITRYVDIGGFQKTLLLGSRSVGDDALIRFYVLHVMVLPLLMAMFLGLHFWRIRKDGGLSRPADADSRIGAPPEGVAPVFSQAPRKSYGLMAVVRGSTPNVGRGPENTLPSWPHLMTAEAAVFMATFAATLALSLFFDAPLKEMANPLIPENPAKAPWYFLGLQEIVSFSAFAGGVLLPALAILGLALIPYLDREPEGVGLWFGARERGKPVFLQSLAFGLAAVLAVEAFAIRFGWLRNWFPGIPQIVITFFNPGTLLAFLYVAYSVWVIRREDSTRLGAIAVFTCFLAGFVVLTLIGTWFRGPNWEFFWSPSRWPVH
jgi:quinol-cytochrome oxidoreductase complex cytochrome b subunit